jgi:hypothetical protein
MDTDGVRFDQFFRRGGTVKQIELLAEDVSPQPISIDDLSIDWILDKASQPTERLAAQFVTGDGYLVYAVPLADQLALVSSEGNVTLTPNDGRAATRSTLTPDAIRRYRRNEPVDLSDVISRVRELLVAHVQFAEAWQPDLIALWVVGTFLHSVFAVFGYLHITSSGKRCGKTLLLDLLGQLCFNATRSSTDPSPAFIFRDAERNCGTQLFDEMESLGDADRKSRPALMAMLNAGFRRGARVPRIVDAKANSFHEFNVYAPRVVAGISRLSTTLADRSFRIELSRKRHDVKLERFTPRRQGTRLVSLIENLHLAALQHAREVTGAYNRADEFNIPAGVDDRLRDIVEPLFAVGAVADKKSGTLRYTQAIIHGAQRLAAIRNEDDAGDDARLIGALSALKALGRPNGKAPVISSSGALALFQRTDGLTWINTREKAQGVLRQLGFLSAIHRRERFVECERSRFSTDTARGYEIKSGLKEWCRCP